MSEEIPNEVLHAFANAYKFNGMTRTSGAGELKMSLPSYGQEWVTIDLMPGLRAAIRTLAQTEQLAGQD